MRWCTIMQCNCLHISNFNDLRKIAMISVLRLIFLWMQPYAAPGDLNVRTTPDQLFIGSIAEMEGTPHPPCNFHLMDQACVTHWENRAGMSAIQLKLFSECLLLPWGGLILPTHYAEYSLADPATGEYILPWPLPIKCRPTEKIPNGAQV